MKLRIVWISGILNFGISGELVDFKNLGFLDLWTIKRSQDF